MLTHDWFWLSCCRRTSGLKHTGTLKTIHRNRGDTKPTPNNLVVSVRKFQIIEIQCSLLSDSWVTDWLQVAPRRHRKQGPAGARPAFPQSQAASEPTTMKNQPGTMKNQLSHLAGQLVNYCGYGAIPSSLPSWWSGWWRTHCFPNLTTSIWLSR